MISRLCSIVAASVLLAAGCAGEMDGEVDQADIDSDAIATVQSPIWSLWGDTTVPPKEPTAIMAMAYSSKSLAYAWRSDGYVCRGSATLLCKDKYPFGTPGNLYKDVVAVGLNASDWVYAYHRDKTYSIGDSATLNSRQEKRSFSSVHPTSQLVDVFNKSDFFLDTLGRWYFYWKAWGANGWVYFRTVGTPDKVDYYDPEQEITVHREHGDIIGIDYSRSSGRVLTWYADGYMNSSTSTVNLGQL